MHMHSGRTHVDDGGHAGEAVGAEGVGRLVIVQPQEEEVALCVCQ